MSPKAKRLLVVVAIAVLGIAVMLVLGALRENIVFSTPTDIASSGTKLGQRLRLGGLVKEGSVTIDGLQSVFTLTDGTADVTVLYGNALPSLFREGQGVVAEGSMDNGKFIATNVLAKHDENIPAEVAEKLKSTGVWKGKNKSAS